MNWNLADVEFATQKIASIRTIIEHLRTSEFAYEEPKDALVLLDRLYSQDLQLLSLIDENAADDVRKSTCSQANNNVARFKKILGFLLRSSNVRNSFEVYDPLARLSKLLLGNDAKLILSSEWLFSPFTYPAAFKELPRFVFIGLPASESGNALVLPLAGHELGHSVWRHTNVSPPLQIKLQDYVIDEYASHWKEFETHFGPADKARIRDDLLIRARWTLSYRSALKQCEEIFCDALGVRIFGEGFLYSFMYLIAPNLGGERSTSYPSLTKRISYLQAAGSQFGVEPIPKFDSFFSEKMKSGLSARDQFSLAMADAAVDRIVKELIEAVDAFCKAKALATPTKKARDAIFDKFQMLCPATGASCLGDIINAGWKVRRDFSVWNDFKLKSGAAVEILNDLVFKTVEVMEFEYRTSRP